MNAPTANDAPEPGKVKRAHDFLFAGKPADTVYVAEEMKAAKHNARVQLLRDIAPVGQS